MSRQTALDNINLRPTDRWGHTDYSLSYHEPYLRKVTGLDPADPGYYRAFCDAWEYDFLWGIDDGICGDWSARGRVTNMGHAEYAADGSDRVALQPSPFHDVEEVWGFDPDAEYGLPTFSEQVEAYRKLDRQSREQYPNQLVAGAYYKSRVSGAIEAFGWDLLLQAAADRRRFELLLDRFFRRTQFHMKAWAKSSADVFVQHDDFVWTSGPFMDPAFYRGAIIPRYAELWKPIHDEGKKVLFCSDGDFHQFAEDVVAAGADGLIFEPCNDFNFMADRFGSVVCLVGSFVDCRDMTFGRWETVQECIDRTMETMRRCRGGIVAVGNHLPSNVPDDMLERYIRYLRKRLPRQ